jgi:hypothetical protein
MALQPFVTPWPLFSFLILYTVGRTPWMGDQPVARPLPTRRTTQTQNKRTQTSMPRVGFESKFQAFERAKTVHALERAATVIGWLALLLRNVASMCKRLQRKSSYAITAGVEVRLREFATPAAMQFSTRLFAPDLLAAGN